MNSVFATFRLIRAGWVLAREGVIAAIPAQGLTGPAATAQRLAAGLARRRSRKLDNAERMTKAIARLGPSYAKLGQFLATRPDVIGFDLAMDLAHLQDRMASFPTADAIARVEDSLGKKVDDLFATFGDPVAAASIAQVHPATVRGADGASKEVAVKVIRPGVRRLFARDLDTFFLFAQLQEKHVPASRRLRPVAIAETLKQSTQIEMDLRLEAAALSELQENTRDDPGFRVPAVDWERTGRDVLTMEWVDGIKMTDIEALRAAGHDLNKLADSVVQSFLRHAMRDGFFHADMHPGNLFVTDNGDIVAVDLGISGRIGLKERRFLAEILYGFIKRDFHRVAQVHFDAGYVPDRHSVEAFAQAIRAIGEPIHGQPAETISMANLLTLLFEVTDIFDMETRPELLLLQKTMVVVEGNARALNPRFNMWKAAEPVVGDWIARNLGPGAVLTDARIGLESLGRLARSLPELADRSERLSREVGDMAENGMRLAPDTVEQIGKAEASHSRSGRIALWIIALAAFWIAWQVT
jgi:ubiquinone biosynthesis protein